MADRFEILVRKCSSIERLVEAVSLFLRHPLERRTDAEWILYKGLAVGFEISIYKADVFENDNGIEFDKYPFIVSIRGLSAMNNAQYFDEWFRLFALMLADIVSQHLVCECLVLKNLFYTIQAFPPSSVGEQ